MAQRKRTKEQTIIYKTLHRILNIEEHESGGELMCPGKVNSSCSTSDTRRVNSLVDFIYATSLEVYELNI
jgi:hypothetical protein